MAPFAAAVTRPTWRDRLVLLAGAAPAPGRRRVPAASSVIGLGRRPTLTDCHRAPTRNRRSGLGPARRLVPPLVAGFAPGGPVVSGLADTPERRWGRGIEARGIRRDPVRSGRGRVVKAGGPRRIAVTRRAPIPWAGRVWARPFPTAPAPPARDARRRGRRPERPTDRGRRVPLLAARRLPQRRVVAAAASSYAAVGSRAAVRGRSTTVTRRRPDARPFAPAPPRRPGMLGRPRARGRRRRPRASPPRRQRVTVTGWYGRSERRPEVVPGPAVRSDPGPPAVPIRYAPVRDVAGAFEPPACVPARTRTRRACRAGSCAAGRSG